MLRLPTSWVVPLHSRQTCHSVCNTSPSVGHMDFVHVSLSWQKPCTPRPPMLPMDCLLVRQRPSYRADNAACVSTLQVTACLKLLPRRGFGVERAGSGPSAPAVSGVSLRYCCRSDLSPLVAAQGWGAPATFLASQKSKLETRPGASCGRILAMAFAKDALLGSWTRLMLPPGPELQPFTHCKVHCLAMARSEAASFRLRTPFWQKRSRQPREVGDLQCLAFLTQAPHSPCPLAFGCARQCCASTGKHGSAWLHRHIGVQRHTHFRVAAHCVALLAAAVPQRLGS